MLIWKSLKNNAFVRRFGKSTDEAWLATLLATVQERVQDGLTFPGFPSVETQQNFVGSANEQALQEANTFYLLVKNSCQTLGIPLARKSNILDFGVGWGRIIRFFLKDVAIDGLYGVDVDPEIVATCRSIGVPGNLSRVEPTGALPFKDDTFHVVYAYSVFSHLSEPAHLFWLQELSRIIRPGGLFVATTQPRQFFSFCESLQGKTHDFGWYRTLAEAFPDPSRALAEYDAGQFVYAPTGAGEYRDASFFGEAAIPRAYVQRVWTRHFKFRNFIDGGDKLWQSQIVMQK
jgi:SAM-dependent methyltransferase